MDISDQINFDDTGIKVRLAYIECGIICLTFDIKEGATAGSHQGSIDLKFAPRDIISGSFSNIGTGADANVCIGQVMRADGVIFFWLVRDVVGYGYVTFIYPLKSAQKY